MYSRSLNWEILIYVFCFWLFVTGVIIEIAIVELTVTAAISSARDPIVMAKALRGDPKTF